MVTFDSLPADCVLDVFKYLNFREKVIYSQISTTWSDLLADTFRSQKRLVFSTDEHVRCSCPTRSHHWTDADVVSSTSIRYEGNCYDSWRLKLVKLCPNLRTIHWEDGVPSSLGGILAEYCPRLEHVGILDTNCDVVFETIKVDLKCAVFINPNGIVDDETAQSGLKSALRLKLDYLETDLPLNFYDERIQWIINEGKQLKGLDLHLNELSEHQLDEVVGNLKCIKSLRICSNPVNFELLSQLTGLTEIYWEVPEYTLHYSAAVFLKVLAQFRGTLKSLSLANPDLGPQFYSQLSELCPNLKEMKIEEWNYLGSTTDAVLNQLVNLTKLVKLELAFTSITLVGLIEFLQKSSKLAWIELIEAGYGIICDQLFDELSHYASRHPKRRITVIIGGPSADTCYESLIATLPSNLRIRFI